MEGVDWGEGMKLGAGCGRGGCGLGEGMKGWGGCGFLCRSGTHFAAIQH